MKKSLLVAALIAGFAGAAQAETSVTLYGLVDSGIGYQQVKGSNASGDYKATRTGILNGGQSGNRWGLKGTEDLGEGLKAVFVLESGFDINSGKSGQSSRLFGRQATIGLASDAWGQVDFGRQTNIASKYFSSVATPFGNDFGISQTGTAFSSSASLRYDNMIMYQTPNFAGFQFGVGYSFNADGNQQFKVSGGDEPNTRAWTTGLRYSNGPLAAALTYDQFKSPEGNGLNDGVNVREWNLGASYDFEVVKVYAGFGQTRNGWFQSVSALGDGAPSWGKFSTLQANDGLKVNSYALGVSAPVGANGQVLAGWTMADPRNNGNRNGNADLSSQHSFSLGYTYNLSKRTNVYALGSYVKNVAFQDDLKSTFVGVGLRHKF